MQMAELNTEGFEFFGEDEQRFRMMLIDRIEGCMVHNNISKSALADKANIGKTAFYSKMDKQQGSQFTVSDLFRLGKVLDVSILQFFPVDEIDRIHGGQLPVPASVLKLMDEMMGMPNQDIELLHSLMQTLKKHQRIN
jgi:hypothetical protein